MTRTLYVSQQGCYVSLRQEILVVKQGKQEVQQVQLPLLEQILVFGKSQLTTQVIRACLQRNIPVAYLSRMGYCYGRVLPVERGYRQLARYQQQLSHLERLMVAQQIVQAKLKNSRVLLLRQQRRKPADAVSSAIQILDYLVEKVSRTETHEQLFGIEGSGASAYFSALGACLSESDFVFMARTKRPPGNPVNAMLSFGYQVLWNHLLTLVELQNLDPYWGCLHQNSERHAALVSDLVEEFRAAIVDSLVLWLVNTRTVNADQDFEYHDGGCYLNNSGRRKYLKAFVQRMEGQIQSDSGIDQPRWDLLARQVKAFKQFVYSPVELYQPYLIR